MCLLDFLFLPLAEFLFVAIVSAPSAFDIFGGGVRMDVHIHLRRIELASLPKDEAGLGDWLVESMREKDQLLEKWQASGYKSLA